MLVIANDFENRFGAFPDTERRCSIQRMREEKSTTHEPLHPGNVRLIRAERHVSQ
jgi:hypothetical protein